MRRDPSWQVHTKKNIRDTNFLDTVAPINTVGTMDDPCHPVRIDKLSIIDAYIYVWHIVINSLTCLVNWPCTTVRRSGNMSNSSDDILWFLRTIVLSKSHQRFRLSIRSGSIYSRSYIEIWHGAVSRIFEKPAKHQPILGDTSDWSTSRVVEMGSNIRNGSIREGRNRSKKSTMKWTTTTSWVYRTHLWSWDNGGNISTKEKPGS